MCQCPVGIFRGYRDSCSRLYSSLEAISNTTRSIQVADGGVGADARTDRTTGGFTSSEEKFLISLASRKVMFFSALFIIAPMVVVAAFILVTATVPARC